jgi:hypothetical protein
MEKTGNKEWDEAARRAKQAAREHPYKRCFYCNDWTFGCVTRRMPEERGRGRIVRPYRNICPTCFGKGIGKGEAP